MKWNFTINQRAIIENGFSIDIVDAAIFDLIKDFAHSGKCKKSIEDAKVYYWISWKFIVEQAPILGLKTRQSVYNRIEKLAANGLIERHPDNKAQSQSWFCFGVNYDKMTGFLSGTPVNENEHPVNETLQPCKQFFTAPVNETLHYTDINNNSIENKGYISLVGVEAVLQKKPIETPTPPPPTPPKKTPQSQKYSEDFEAFWKLYDKADGGGKKQCYDKWVKLPFEEKRLIMAHVADYKKKQPDPQYRKNPITYFNQKPWIDFVPKNEITQPKRNERIDTRLLWGEPA